MLRDYLLLLKVVYARLSLSYSVYGKVGCASIHGLTSDFDMCKFSAFR